MANAPVHPKTAANRPSRDDDLLQRAALALSARRPAEAERLAAEVLKTSPHQVQALKLCGRALLMQGRVEDVIALLEPAARSRHDPDIETQLAIALRQAGRLDDALSRLRRATKRQPPYAPACSELGYVLTSLKRFDEAIEALKRGLEVAPMMPDLFIQLGYLQLRRRNHGDAKGAFARALELSPASPDALFGMAKTHQEIHENRTAVAYFRQYLTTRPAHWGAWLSLGHCLLELGDLDAGYECFRTAARGDPQHYANAMSSLVKSPRGRFWLKPSAAAQFLLGQKANASAP